MSSTVGRYVLGVDGGNTKTIAAIADFEGRIVGLGRSGCSDIYGADSVEQALQEMTVAIERARHEAGVTVEELAAGGFSLAGADWPEDIEFLQLALAARGYRGPMRVVNDAMGALQAGSPDGTGVVVVCGTGAATGARREDGREWHTSWWQEPQGSRDLAEKTLRAVYRADLRIGPATTLSSRILQLFGEESVEAVLHRLTARLGRAVVNHAGITCALLDEAERGDPTASRIVRDHGRSLGDYALAAASRIELEQPDFWLVLIGGVFRHPGSLLPGAIVDRVRAGFPRVRPVISRNEPVIGAVLLALEGAGVSIDESIRTCLRQQALQSDTSPIGGAAAVQGREI